MCRYTSIGVVFLRYNRFKANYKCTKCKNIFWKKQFKNTHYTRFKTEISKWNISGRQKQRGCGVLLMTAIYIITPVTIVFSHHPVQRRVLKFNRNGGAAKGCVRYSLRFCPATVISFEPNVILQISQTNRKTAASAILLCIERDSIYYTIHNGKMNDE